MISVKHGQVVVTTIPLLTEQEYASDWRHHVPPGSEAMYVDSVTLNAGPLGWHRLAVAVESMATPKMIERYVLAHDSQFALPPVKAFRLKWTETHVIEHVIETDELAEALGIGVEQLLDMDRVRLGDLIDEKLLDRSEWRAEAEVSSTSVLVEEERD